MHTTFSAKILEVRYPNIHVNPYFLINKKFIWIWNFKKMKQLKSVDLLPISSQSFEVHNPKEIEVTPKPRNYIAK